MKSKNKKFMIYLVAHYLFFPFYFNFINKRIQQFFIFGSLFLYLLTNLEYLKYLFEGLTSKLKTLIISIFILILTVSASICIPIVQGTYDFDYFEKILTAGVYTMGFVSLEIMIQKYCKTDALTKSFEVFISANRHYALVTLLFVIFPKLKNFWLSLILITEDQLKLINRPQYTTRVGWSGYSGFTKTFSMTIAIILCFYLILRYYEENKEINFKYMFYMLVLLAGNAFYGRAGLAVSLFTIFIFLLYFTIRFNRKDVLLKITFSILGLFVIISIFSNFIPKLDYWYKWLMEPLINLFESGDLVSNSTDQLKKMWFLPPLNTFLVGDGYYSDPNGHGYYMGTDVGYLRPILFYGIVYTVLNYIVLFILANILGRKNKNLAFISFIIVISVLIFEVKGEVIFEIIPLMIYFIISSRYDKKSKVLQEEKNELKV